MHLDTNSLKTIVIWKNRKKNKKVRKNEIPTKFQGKEGAVAEALLKRGKAMKLYENGLVIIEQLLSESYVESDRVILQTCEFFLFFLISLELYQDTY
jgi:hypothetical protein